MPNLTINIPVPYMLSSAERQAWIDSTLKQKSLYLDDISAKVVDVVYAAPMDTVKMELQLTGEQHEEWMKAFEQLPQTLSIEAKQDDQ